METAPAKIDRNSRLPRPNWGQRRVRLEIESPVEEAFELFLGLGLLLVLLGVVGLPFFSGYGLFWAALPCFATTLLGRALFDGTYFLDRTRGELSYRRRIGPVVQETAVAALDQVAVVTVRGQSTKVEKAEGESKRAWSYRLLVMLVDGTSIPVSDATPDLADANGLAGELARELDVPLVPGHAEQVLEHVPETKLPEVIRTQTRAGAEAERLVGHGLFVGSMAYFLALPALAYPGAWTWHAAQAMLVGAGSLAAVAGLAALTVFCLGLGLPAGIASLRLLHQAGHRPSTEAEAEEVETEGFEDGLELWMFLLLGNGLASATAWIGGHLATVDPALQLGALALMNLAVWFSWAFTGLRLPADASPALPESVRLHLLGSLQRRQARCGYCGVTITPEVVVACNTCEALHHRECWDEFGRCTTFGCGSSAASPVVT